MKLPLKIHNFLGAIVFLLGTLVLTGWYTHIHYLIQVIPQAAPMQPNTALCFMVLGAKLFCCEKQKNKFFQFIFISIAIGIPLLTLIEYLANIQLPVDTWLLPSHPIMTNTSHPGRMSPITAFSFILLSTSSLLVHKKEYQKHISIFLASIVISIGFIALTSYLLNLEVLYGWSNFTRMAIHTSLGMILSGVAVLNLQVIRDFSNIPLRIIRNSFIAYSFNILLLCTFLASVLTFLPIYNQLALQKKEDLLNMIVAKSAAIDQYFDKIESDSKLISSRILLRDILLIYEKEKTSLPNLQDIYQKSLSAAFKNNPILIGYSRYQNNGNELFHIGTAFPENIPNILNIKNSSLSYQTFPLLDQEQNLALFVLNPVSSAEGNTIAYDLFQYSTNPIREILANFDTIFKSSKFFLLVSIQNKQTLFALKENNIKKSPIPSDSHFTEAYESALKKEKKILEQNSAQITPFLYAVTSLVQNNWGMIGEIETNEIYKNLNKPITFVFFIITGFLVLFSSGYLIFMKPLSSGILIQESKLEEEIREKTLSLQNELSLRKKAEERFKLVTEGTLEGIWDWNIQTGEVYFSPIFKQMLGYTDAEFPNLLSSWENALHPEDKTKTYAEIEKHFKTRTPYNNEHRLLTKKQGYHWFRARGQAHWDEQGNVYRMLGSILDVDDEIKLREEFQKNKDQLQSILDNTTAVIYAKSTDGRYIFVNQRFEILFNKKRDEIIGKTDQEIFLPEFAEKFRQNDLLTLQKNNPLKMEESVLQNDGLHTYVSIKFPLKDSKGLAYATCGISTDITQEKRTMDSLHAQNIELEEKNKILLENTERLENLQMATINLLEDIEKQKSQLKDKTEKLTQLNQQLESFAYVASHDLQEPLRKILAFGDRLKDKAKEKLNTEELDYLQRMTNASGRMKKLIEDLLKYSRISTQQQKFTRIDLNQLLHEVLDDLETRIEQSGGKIDSEKLPTIEADSLQMRQLFQNLLSNALKFHKTGQGTQVSIKSDIRNNKLTLSFEDNGIGFDDKFKDRIFQPFQRLHGRQEYEGTGIGLAICKKIIEHHHGSIEVQSEENKGSKFIITLPLQQTQEGSISV